MWALLDYGFAVVISSRFADIFRGNSLKAGLLTVVLPEAVVLELQAAVTADPQLTVTVDLPMAVFTRKDRNAIKRHFDDMHAAITALSPAAREAVKS